MTYLPYIEPGLDIILPLSTFVLLLNITRCVLDNLLYCGLIGEIFIGIIFGMPGAGTSWLGSQVQETVQYLGYLGLVGLVFEGGLTTDLGLLRKTIGKTVSAAFIGIIVPMVLSLSLMAINFGTAELPEYPTALAAFSAGVSLCSTSLGSTFIILASANMQKTPTGTLIAGAAMIDDVIVLVMVKIVTALGQGQTDAWTIARPAVSSLGLVLISLLLAPFIIRPIFQAICSMFAVSKDSLDPFEGYGTFESHSLEKGTSRHTGFLLSSLMLVIFITIAACIEGSLLLAAFLAGAMVRYVWQAGSDTKVDYTTVMFEEYYKPIMDYIFIPFFFASIGFSIPISEMFTPSIAWKGAFYAVMMTIAKAVVGVVVYFDYFAAKRMSRKVAPSTETGEEVAQQEPPINEGRNNKVSKPKAPHLNAIIVGSTMIARGGFGFLVASEAQSSGTLSLRPKAINPFEAHDPSIKQGLRTLDIIEDQVFLVIIWALVLCTIVGPIISGCAVRRKLMGNECECGMTPHTLGEDVGCHLCL